MPSLPQVLAFAALTTVAVAQTTTWTSFADRRGHAMARAQNGQVVTFGGQSTGTSGALLEDTHQFTQSGSNSTWSSLQDGPEPRTEHAMASAQVNGQPDFIAFGGATANSTPTNSTFRYRGSGWHDVRPPIGTPVPIARVSHAMVNHLGSQTLLMFGGYDGAQALNDLWEFLPAIDTWQQRQPTGTAPSPRSEHAMAYCAANQKVYVFGGTPFLGDLYEYDLALDQWQQKFPAGSTPPGRRKAAMAYVNGAGGIVLFGGLRFGTVLGDTWLYEPLVNQWSQLSFSQPTPAPRFDHAVSVDATGNKLVLLGGTDNANTVFTSTWQFNSNTFEWEELLPAPSQRTGVGMAYDSTRARHVVFGGKSVAGGTELDETWEIDGVNWRATNPGTRPSARSDAGMAFDATRNRTVLFGGRAPGGGNLGDTWEWNGATWTLRTFGSNPLPPAAAGTQPVFDPVRGKVWLLVQGQMWSYDGSTWAHSERPSPRRYAAHAYDSVRQRLVVFGGQGPDFTGIQDTWLWNGAAWSRLALALQPPVRTASAMCFHAPAGHCVLFGGYSDLLAANLGDAWTFDGFSWQQRAAATSTRAGHALQYNPADSRSTSFGGSIINGQQVNTTEFWNGTSWLVHSGSLPPPRAESAMAYHPSSGRLVMFGGGSGSTDFGDTWTFDGTTWVQASPTNLPPAGRRQLVYDSRTQRVLMFGGWSAATGQVWDDTWLWDGSNWTAANPNPAQRPQPRMRHMLFSTGSRTLVWAGSTSGNSGFLNDMWEWNGSAWTLIDSGTPAALTNYAACYDASRDRVIVFGGMTGDDPMTATFSNETWEWDGDSWLQRFPGMSPSPRGRARMAFDSARRRVVLYGGIDASVTHGDTWEWDGTTWTLVAPVANPPAMGSHAMTFDANRSVAVAYSPQGTWDYGAVHAAAATTYGAGCQTSAGGPLTLLPKPWAGPWLGDRLEVDFQHQPALSLGIFLWGFSDTMSVFGPLPAHLGFLNAPNCNILASSEVTELILPGTTTYTSFVLPNHPSLLGAVMFGQAGFFDAGLGNVPVTSNALRLLFGQR